MHKHPVAGFGPEGPGDVQSQWVDATVLKDEDSSHLPLVGLVFVPSGALLGYSKVQISMSCTKKSSFLESMGFPNVLQE